MLKKWIGLCAMALISIGVYFGMPYLRVDRPAMEDTIAAVQASSDSTEIDVIEPEFLYGMPVDSMVVIEAKIKNNQNLSDILLDYNVPYKEIHQLAQVSKPIFDVRKIAANKKYTIICHPDSLTTAKAFVYEPNAMEYVVFNLSDSITVEKVSREVELIERSASGIIETSLSDAMQAIGLGPQLTNNFVDVFGWQVDFFRLQKGDRFKLVYEDKIVDGTSVGIGEIKGIYFEHFNNPYYAIHYDQGSGADHFDENGNSLQKALLKYPLKFSRISSRYSGNRYHPVQKRWKAHRGTDFAAPRGTEIRSVGDGIITEARFSKYNGNFVKVKHNSTYTTQYLHMSKIASGIKRGTRVRQGQTIGYVGSTGLATGNHLCYRFWKAGVQVDALKVKLPPSEPIKEEHRDEFMKIKSEIVEKLNAIPFPDADKELMVRK